MKKVLDWLIYIICEAFAIFVFIYKDSYSMIIMVGAIFLIVLGVLLIFNKNNYASLVLLLGVCLEISYLLYKFKVLDRSSAIVFMFIFSLFNVLLMSVIRYFTTIKKSIDLHKMELEGTIVDLAKNPNFKKEVLVPLVEYKIKSEYFEFNYIIDDPKYVPKIGDKVKIYVNPNDYYDVYLPPSKRVIIKGLASTIFIMIASLLLLIDIFI